ncbi:MAG: hypothetical protein COB66_01480 [Coxiella sp. (in: Bacteria)]|nr:MAG: hypothetical protein COB66_01480 [Coxiella sp. (in: g-proteobacteria)]
MKRKDTTVETEFHPKLNFFLTWCDDIYRSAWGAELIITSGSEDKARHGFTSLHYAKPCCAADIRSWGLKDRAGRLIATAKDQYNRLRELRDEFCADQNIPSNWIDIILESDHIHIEFQPKRREI